MVEIIRCPVCEAKNPADQEFCQFCQSRLQPLTGPLKGMDEAITPGQIPTKKDTGELEQILPQWLRDARSSGRENSENDVIQAAQPSEESNPISIGADLLAGLQSQAQDSDEEDVPDWLTSITGEAPKSTKTRNESTEVRWVELGGKDDFPQGQEEPVSDAPSWLSGLTPSKPQQPVDKVEKDELANWFRDASNTPKSQEPQQSTSDEDSSFFAQPVDNTPDWLRAMAAENTAPGDSKPLIDSDNKFDSPSTSSDTPDWLRSMAAEDSTQNDNTFSNDLNDIFDAVPPEILPSSSSTSSDTPDWLRSMAAEDSANNDNAFSNDLNDIFAAVPPASLPSSSASSDTPDWLRSMAADDNTQSDGALSNDLSDIFNAAPSTSSVSSSSSDTPDWLKMMSPQGSAQSADSAGFSETSSGESDAAEGMSTGAGDVPDWLKGLESETPTTASSSSDQDWLKGLQAGQSEQPLQGETPSWLTADEPQEETEIPAWLTGAPTSEPVEPEQKQTPEVFAQDDSSLELGDVPSWLKAVAPRASIYESPSEDPKSTAFVESSSITPDALDTPDWLSSFKSDDMPETQAAPAFFMDDVVSKPPAFIDDSQIGENADSLFTDMPDWLSNVESPSSSSSTTTPISDADAIVPGELPSWVQAMRPVDSGVSQSSSISRSSDQSLESRGVLAGLQGVLPSVPGFNPTSKPKAYSIKLQASEEQQSHAALLEQILAAETEPVPLSSFSTLATSRVLRWLLTLVLLASLVAVLILRTQIFAMPFGVPSEIIDSLQVAQSIPEGAPVLVVFDYEPARVGEMEVAAAPMFDQMLLLRHPHLTFISTSETGAILAERFISGPLAGHNYQSGVGYLNLGYLPGGQMGISSFAHNPRGTSEFTFARNTATTTFFDMSLTPAWTSDPWSGITSLSQFSAIIIVTDNADSAREWIEQTTSTRGTIPVVAISSAQSAPMIQPYYASGQLSGLVSGLYGGAVFEQNNNGHPGTARTYWDAYSIGMLLAMVLILVGGLWNLALGLRDRAAAREAK